MHPRLIEPRIRAALKDTPIVALNGPRQSGKTTLAKHIAGGDFTYLTLDDPTVLAAARSDPTGFVRGLDRAIIDEVQRAPDLMLALKKTVDENRRPGRFLVTGSANLLAVATNKESLAGRMELVALLPLTQAEIRDQSNASFLDAAFKGAPPPPGRLVIGSDLVDIVLTGGYPGVLERQTPQRRRAWCTSYIEAIANRDVRDISSLHRPGEIPRLIRVAAHRAAQLLNAQSISNDLGLTGVTVRSYLDVLEQLFLLKRLEPWHRNGLSRLIKAPKLYFMDSALLAATGSVTAERISAERSLFGPVLETFVFAELQRLAAFHDEELRFSFYRDKDQVEVDFVLENDAGDMIGIEVKAAATVATTDFKGLRKLAQLNSKTFRAGLVLYDGDAVVPFGDGLYAAPMSSLWAS